MTNFYQIPVRVFIAIVTLSMATSCSTVTIRKDATREVLVDPDYIDTKAFFLWGYVGEHHVNAPMICGNRGVVQMQAESAWDDVLFSVLTLGLYFPRTAYVWCEKRSGTL